MPEIGGIGLATAFFAGMVSFLSPCVLPLVPGYLSAITGITPTELERAGWRSVIPPALTFIASFSLVWFDRFFQKKAAAKPTTGTPQPAR